MSPQNHRRPAIQLWLGGGFIVSGGLRAFYAIDLGWDRFRLLSAAIQLGLGTGLFLDGLRRARRGDDGTDPWPTWLGIGGTVLGVALLIGTTFPESLTWWVGPGAALTGVGAFQIRRCITEHRSHGPR